MPMLPRLRFVFAALSLCLPATLVVVHGQSTVFDDTFADGERARQVPP